jgi:molybdopterin-guanine dinucleotide biosynthesis protein MobB
MRIVSVVGHKNAGKTTLVVALAREFSRQGRRVATIKHASHPARFDAEGTDSWRHFHEGMADGVLVAGPGLRALVERRPDDTDPETLARRFFADRDLVLVEGFKQADLPKIEVYRRAVAPAPLVASAEHPGRWIALATDSDVPGVSCLTLRFNDTMWLQLLASHAWASAKVVGE